jgi:hypothetical protein
LKNSKRYVTAHFTNSVTVIINGSLTVVDPEISKGEIRKNI